MSDATAVISAIIGAAALLVAYLTYLRQRNKTGLEYLVVGNTRVVPRATPTDLEVTYKGSVVPDASVVVVRIVNTGDKAILPEDFRSPLAIKLHGANRVVSALTTKTRPVDLGPAVSAEENCCLIQPLLINPTDMIQVQLLASGLAANVALEGRIANVGIKRRSDLPYPPGTGPEGELANGFEKFMWYGMPAIFAALLAWLAVTSSANIILEIAAVAGFFLFAFVINPWYTQFLIRRRRMWAP
ncbi:hypothetical protein [Micromonospora musae]|uniref:hypothetical protein n=1 Tax=Micromonospora musae TaxID=1894970 RepID=UPI0011C416F5|nr:hypothetical protein [Micromonospora musae]